MDILDIIKREDPRVYGMGLYETYLIRPHIYMPLVRFDNGRIADLTMENL